MVEPANGADLELTIQPNRSMSPRSLVVVALGLGIVLLGIATAFWWIGAWLVAPFAVIELTVIGIVVLLVCHHSGNYEKLCVSGDQVHLTRRIGSGQRRYVFQRGWMQVKLDRGRYATQPSRLTIGSHGRHVEIGTGLTEQSRQRLSTKLSTIFGSL